MRKVSIKLPKQPTLSLRKELTSGRFNGHDPEELFYMQSFPAFRQHKKGFSHENVAQYCKANELELAYGYKVWRYKKDKHWKKQPYSFALDKGRVIDLDRQVDWADIDVHFMGVVVEPLLFKNSDYVKFANVDFYKRRSSFSLYEKDYLDKEDKK